MNKVIKNVYDIMIDARYSWSYGIFNISNDRSYTSVYICAGEKDHGGAHYDFIAKYLK